MPTAKPPAMFKSPSSQAVYARLLAGLKRVGPFEAEVKKTSVHLVHGRAFAGVHPRATGIELQIVTVAPIRSARIRKVEQVSKHRCHCAVKLESPAEVDAQLLGWLKAAYALTKSD